MSQLTEGQREAKIQFLNFIMAADFQAGELIYNKELDKGLGKLHFIATKIYYMVNQEQDIKELYQVLQEWIEHFERCTQTELINAYARLSLILSKYFYSELQLGIVPTGTMQQTKDAPGKTAFSPEQSSRL